MHDDDLTDLAMLAACCHRLIARSEDRLDATKAKAISNAASTSLTVLCDLFGASADQVIARIGDLRGDARKSDGKAVH